MGHSILLVILPLLCFAMASQLTIPSDAVQVQAQAPAPAPAQAQPIYDTDGHELTKENLYHILPADPKMRGLCLYVGTLSSADCPLRAVVSPCWPNGGVPVMVMPAETGGGSVPRLSSDLLLTFNNTYDQCMMELQWHIEDYLTTQQMHVTVGHFLGAQAPLETAGDKMYYRFRAERHGNGYKLTWCYKEPCRDLVLFDYEGGRWLTVDKDGRQPFVVVFKKCPSPCRPSLMTHIVSLPN